MDTFRCNWGINGNDQLTGSLRRDRPSKQFGHMVGHIDNEKAQQELLSWIKAGRIGKLR